MARQFNGTSQALTATSVAMGGGPVISVSFWLYITGDASGDEMILESDATKWYIDHNANLIILQSYSNVGAHEYYFSAIGSANTWHHYVAIFDVNQTIETELYLNGSAVTGTLQASANNTSNYAATGDITFMNRVGGSLWSDGRLAEVGVWNMRLTGGNITSLAGTLGVANSAARPSTIQAANLKGYWALLGTTSPEPDTSGAGHDATLTGTPTQVTHPVEPNYLSAATLMGAMCL